MALHRSHGKLRPEAPRSRDLALVRTVGEPAGTRGAGGRFAAGNEAARGRGWRRALTKMLGREAADLAGVPANVAADAWRLFVASMRDMPSDGAVVRGLVARLAKHTALESYWGAKAIEQLGTPEGDQADDRASRHGQRATQLAVAALDVATKLKAAKPPAWPAWGPPQGPAAGDEGDEQQEDDDMAKRLSGPMPTPEPAKNAYGVPLAQQPETAQERAARHAPEPPPAPPPVATPEQRRRAQEAEERKATAAALTMAPSLGGFVIDEATGAWVTVEQLERLRAQRAAYRPPAPPFEGTVSGSPPVRFRGGPPPSREQIRAAEIQRLVERRRRMAGEGP